MPPRRRPTAAPAAARPSGPAPAELLAGFQQYLSAECGLAQNTLLAYTRDLKRFANWHQESGSPPLAQIELSHLSAYVRALYDMKLATTSIARHLASLKMFFKYLVLDGVLASSVAELLNAPKLWEHLPKVLSAATVNKLLAAPSRDDPAPARDRAILTMLYATGCRVSELANMIVRDVAFDEGYCRCTGKGNKQRMVSLNPLALAALTNYLETERQTKGKILPESPLFATRSGRAMTRIEMWKIVKRCAARIGISKDVSPHTLRHSFATHMLAGGAEIRALQELLGHASIRTTQIYTHVEHSRLKALHEKCHPRG